MKIITKGVQKKTYTCILAEEMICKLGSILTEIPNVKNRKKKRITKNEQSFRNTWEQQKGKRKRGGEENNG